MTEFKTCKDCVFCVRLRQEKGFGRCYRFPPTVTIDGVMRPKVDPETDWCGEFRDVHKVEHPCG
jgi:hypothetical protein